MADFQYILPGAIGLPQGSNLLWHEAKTSHEKIEILNYDTSLRGEHVFRSLMTPGV